jgi:dipeptidyl aminopeptidase/acylaminoacyl peptidase
MQHLLLIILLLNALNPAAASALDIHRDLTYATVDNVELKLDLYLPKNKPAGGGGERPPLIIWIHGRLDPLVPVTQAQRLHEAQQKAGAPSELLIDPDGGHGNNMFDPATFTRIEHFFRHTLNFPASN